MPTISRPVLAMMILFTVLPVALVGAPIARAQLSQETLMLLPADVIGLVVFSSLDDVEQHLLAPVREVMDEGDAEQFEMKAMLPSGLQSLMDDIDPTQPLVIAFTLGAGYGPPEPMSMVLLPVVDGIDAETMAMVGGFSSAEVLGNYVALSRDPGYAAAGAVPALAQGLPAGQMVGRVDLETIFALTRPMIEMMLASMEASNQDGQSATGMPAVPNPGLQGIRGLMDSGRVGEFALAEGDGELELMMGLDIFADSVFDVGPQPPLSDALAMAGHLPDYGEMVSVCAMDLNLLYQNMPFLRSPSMMQLSKGLAQLDRVEAVAWWTTAEELSRPFERASAVTARVYEESIEFVQVAKLDDAVAQLQKIDEHLAALPGAQLGFVLQPVAREQRGDAIYRRYQWEFDPTQIAGLMAEGEEMPSEEDVDELTGFLRAMMPPLHLAAQGDRMLIALVPEGEEAELVLDRFTSSPKMPPMALEGLQQWAGPKVQMMAQVELRSLLQEVMAALASFDPEEAVEVPDGEPVRIRYTSRFGEVRHESRLQTRTGALLRFIDQLEELEKHDD